MRLCRITPDLDIVITEKSPSDLPNGSCVVPLFRGYPGRKVRACRLLLRTAARYSAATPLAAAAVWLCRQELAEMVLACDPDMVDVTGVHWGSHLRRALEPQFPRCFSDAALDGASRSGGWRRFDPSAKVSIVLPVYKVCPYLQQSIGSCLTQTHRNIELLVVDDGSADNVGTVANGYNDPRVHLLRHVQNRGIAAALNTGFEAATGDFLTWTSDDNYYHPSAIAEMLGFLQTYPNIDFVYAEMHIIDERPGVHQPRVWEVKPPQWLWAKESNPVGACFLYRRRVFEELRGYDTSAFLVEDYEYWLRVAKRFRMQRLFKPLYYYRYHTDTLTARHDRSEVLAKLREVKRQHGAWV